MKKAMKKVLVAVLSALMVLGSFVIPAAADDDEFQACVEGQFDTSFEGNFDEWADLKADYTMTLKKDGLVTYKADYGQKVKFSGNYVGLNTSVPVVKDADDKVINDAALVSVKLDGVEVEIADKSYLTAEGIDGGVRINLTNQWNGDITTQPIAPEVWETAFQVIEVQFYINDTDAPAPGGDEEPTDEESTGKEFDPAGKYNAQLAIQFDGSWIFRDAYGDYGMFSDYEFKNGLSCVNEGTPVKIDGTFTDVEIAGNGTYSVTLTGAALSTPSGAASTKINIISLATDLPASAADVVKFTDVKICVNDNFAYTYTYKEGVPGPDDLEKDLINILGVNAWNNDTCAEANTIFQAEMPATIDKVEITFTVSGFSYDKAAEGDNNGEEGTTAAPTDAAKEEKEGGLSTGALIAIIAGCVAVVAVIVVVVVVSSKKKKAN